MKKLVPKRRFEQFKDSEAWQQRKLGEVIEKLYNGQTPSRFNANNWGGNINWLSSGELNRGVVTETIERITDVGKKDANLHIVPKGTFVMAITGLEAVGTRGNCAKLAIDTTLNQSCMALFPKQNILDSDFLFHWYRKVGEEYGVGYTQGTKQQSYNAELIKILPITLPKIEEQKKLAQFFTELDNLITLHQRKLKKLKNLKSAYLSEMFPKDGEFYPKRRFAGFTDPWEQRKLETIYDKIRNAFVGTATPYYVPQGNFYLESNNVKDGQINRKSEIFINDEFYLRQKDNWLRTGDMVMVQSGHVGHAAVIPPELNNSASHALIIFSNPKEIINPYFLNYQYQTSNYKKAIDNITTGNTIKHILSTEMKKFTVLLAEIEEQNKISEFFLDLDNLITLHQRKLEKLEALKQAYLSEMFI